MMKLHKLTLVLLFSVAVFSLQGCLKDTCERVVTYTRLKPVYKTLEEIRTGTAVVEAARNIENPGEIYYYNNHIFIGEIGEGIHVIDNNDPQNPVNKNFVAIPGNSSFTIKGNILYASSYVDLLIIDLGLSQSPNFDGFVSVLGRSENVFPPLWRDDASNSVAVTYEEVTISEELDCGTYGNFYTNREGGLVDIGQLDGLIGDPTDLADDAGTDWTDSTSERIVGSMSRFNIIGDYLYTMDQTSLGIFNISSIPQATNINKVEIGSGIESFYSFQDKLFVGSTAGIVVYDISSPENPIKLTDFAHATACDPLFVRDDIAFVAHSSGNECQGHTNQLDLINIANISSPLFLKSFAMDNPQDLVVAGQYLFLSEGDFGLKSYDISNPSQLDQHLLDHENNFAGFDIFMLDESAKLLLVLGKDGLYQYSFEHPADLLLMSKIPIN